MFYSHQLLARKAPLGQIWMAATLHAKMNRTKLDSLNIIQICEEILNPSVPMALRLSGILMGGVVIVYERKVKLLYDDVNRLLVELNEAWKVNATPSDPTRFPKNKAQAKHGAVTLPKSRVEDLGEIEQSLQYSNATTIMGFQQTSYVAMRLDSVDDAYFNQNPQDELNHDHHQVDAANITLFEDNISHQADTNRFNRFERFDIEGDEDFTPPEHTEIPSSLIPSPPPHDEPMKNDEIQEEHPEEQAKQHSDESKDAKQHSEESKEAKQGQMRKRPTRRIRRRPLVMDDDQNIIPGHIYQTWIRNPSDILAGRGRKRKTPMDALSTMKISTLMDLPSMVIFERLFTSTNTVYYPPSLLELWMRITQPSHDSPSGRISPPQPPEPSSSLSPPERMRFMDDPVQDHFDDHHHGQGFQSDRISVEKQRANDYNNEPPETLMKELRNNLKNNGLSGSNANLMATPATSGDDGIRSIPSSGSGNGLLSHNSDANSGRSGKKRPFSASKNSGNNLEPVAEEFSWQHADLSFKLAKLSENGTPDDDLLETGPTQTQKRPVVNQPLDHITDSIRMHLKTHFDTPGSANAESLNHLTSGMNRKRAACLFYQTCVLATRDYVKVEQIAPYGDIVISRGAKM